MPIKLTYEEVVEIFNNKNCELLSDEYINSRAKLKFKCKCGEISEKTLGRFQNSPSCKKCGIKNKTKTERIRYKYTLLEVSKIFEDNNCKLLSKEYINSASKLDYLCECGSKSQITLNKFLKGQRCMDCKNNRTRERLTLSYEDVKEYFKLNNCELISDEYLSSKIALNYICECGRNSTITLGSFRRGCRCFKCGTNKNRNNIEDIISFINSKEGNGCTYISGDYLTSTYSKLLIKCSCGYRFEATLNQFKASRRECETCVHKNKCVSKGESKIKDYLIDKNIQYKSQLKFDGCFHKDKLPFDFAILLNNNLLFLIEYDGIQHFEPVEFFGGIEGFKNTQLRDGIKNKYCADNGIHLLRIPYWEFDSIEEIIYKELKKYNLIKNLITV